MEKLNIEGRRSGEGFVTSKANLVTTLSRAIADRVALLDVTIGRKGFTAYLRALSGSNTVKVVPASGIASDAQDTKVKGLKVICGTNVSYLQENAWIGEKTPMTFCEVRVSPHNSVSPNIGTTELAEALNRVLPFTAKDDARPVLSCVLFRAKEGKLTMVSADGFRLAVANLDCEGIEGEALINREDLRGIANALRHAKRVRVSLEASGESLDGMSLIVDTELIRYKWTGLDGSFPDYEKLIPNEQGCIAHFDTTEAIRATQSLNILADTKVPSVDITMQEGKLTVSNPDEHGQAEVTAEVTGEGYVRVQGDYLVNALRACGGMVDLKVKDSTSPMLFSTDGYRLVVMPMVSDKVKAKAKAEAPQAEAPTTEKKHRLNKRERKAQAKAEAEARAPATEPEKELAEVGA